MRASRKFETSIEWTGNRGSGTSAYRAYDRNWNLAAPGRAVLACSNDPALGGDPALYNPEELLIAALSACHMLWYLHLCAEAGVTVTAYRDDPVGEGEVEAGGAGRFLSATLRPRVTIAAGSDPELARAIHWRIHEYCFIARSVSFPVDYRPVIEIADGAV